MLRKHSRSSQITKCHVTGAMAIIINQLITVLAGDTDEWPYTSILCQTLAFVMEPYHTILTLNPASWKGIVAASDFADTTRHLISCICLISSSSSRFLHSLLYSSCLGLLGTIRPIFLLFPGWASFQYWRSLLSFSWLAFCFVLQQMQCTLD